MNKINKILIGSMIVLILFTGFNRQQSTYPASWNEVHLGMTKQEVYGLVGAPTDDWGEIKGGFWVQDKFTRNHVLWVFFENDRVKHSNITSYIGTSQHFYTQNVHSESDSTGR